jgi:hypothetical protein
MKEEPMATATQIQVEQGDTQTWRLMNNAGHVEVGLGIALIMSLPYVTFMDGLLGYMTSAIGCIAGGLISLHLYKRYVVPRRGAVTFKPPTRARYRLVLALIAMQALLPGMFTPIAIVLMGEPRSSIQSMVFVPALFELVFMGPLMILGLGLLLGNIRVAAVAPLWYIGVYLANIPKISFPLYMAPPETRGLVVVDLQVGFGGSVLSIVSLSVLLFGAKKLFDLCLAVPTCPSELIPEPSEERGS